MNATKIPVITGGVVPAGAPAPAERSQVISAAVKSALRSVAENQAYLPAAKSQGHTPTK